MQDAQSSPPKAPPRRWLRTALGALAYLLLVWLVARKVDLREVGRNLAAIGGTGVGAILGLSLLHIAARALRFHWLVRRAGPTVPCGPARSLHVFLVGLSASAVTPGRMGDLVKAQLLTPYGLPLPVGVALVLSERALDLAVVALFVMVFGAVIGGSTSLGFGGVLVLSAIVLPLAALVAVARRPRLREAIGRLGARLLGPERAARLGASLRELLRTGGRVFPRLSVLLGALAASALAWSIEFFKLWAALRFLGATVAPEVVLFAYPASILAGVAALLPVSEGVVGLTGATLLVALGHVSPAVAASAVIIDRAASTLPPLVLWLGSSLAHGLAAPRHA